MVSIQDMPNEVLKHITDYLPVPARCAFAATCSEYSVWSPSAAITEAREALFNYMLRHTSGAIGLQADLAQGCVGAAELGLPIYARARLHCHRACVIVTARLGRVVDLQVRAAPGPARPDFEPNGYSNDTVHMYRGTVTWVSGDRYVCCVKGVWAPSPKKCVTTWNVLTPSGKSVGLVLSCGVIYREPTAEPVVQDNPGTGLDDLHEALVKLSRE